MTEPVVLTDAELASTVTVGDLIQGGYGDYLTIAVVTWTGPTAAGVRLICLVPPVGDGQFAGMATSAHMRKLYVGWTDENGHRWRLPDGWHKRTDPWWKYFRQPVQEKQVYVFYTQIAELVPESELTASVVSARWGWLLGPTRHAMRNGVLVPESVFREHLPEAELVEPPADWHKRESTLLWKT